MKGLIFAGIVFFLIMVVLTTLIPSPAAEAEAARYFTPAEIACGKQYALERRLFFWAYTGLWLGVLTVLVGTGLGRRWADAFARFSGGRWWLALLLMGGLCFVLHETLALPMGWLHLEHLRSWGMTNRSVPSWLAEHAKALVLSGLLNGLVLLVFYGLLRWFPRSWWALAAGGGGLLGVAFAWLLPLVIAPLFNTFTPLSETPWANLDSRVQTLAQRAGLTVHEVLVMDASRQGQHSNAYFTGFGNTRRIVLYDTLLEQHTRMEAETAAGCVGQLAQPLGPLQAALTVSAARMQGEAEIESILAHEIGHWRHQHIVKGVALATLGAFLGFYLLSGILRRLVGRPPLYLTGPADPAGLPLLLLLGVIGSWLAWPVENAISRNFERQADVAALELAGQAQAFINAEKRLARLNKMNVAPTPFNIFVFATHPPTVERIRLAEWWLAKR